LGDRFEAFLHRACHGPHVADADAPAVDGDNRTDRERRGRQEDLFGVEKLLRSGIGGPYGLALGRELWSDVVESAERGGYPLLRHLGEILGGPTVWTPGVQEAVVVSLRGGDFLFDAGEDISIGYADHSTGAVDLYLEETFSFRVATPEAAVALTP